MTTEQADRKARVEKEECIFQNIDILPKRIKRR
jgi:hypothetical protein